MAVFPHRHLTPPFSQTGPRNLSTNQHPRPRQWALDFFGRTLGRQDSSGAFSDFRSGSKASVSAIDRRPSTSAMHRWRSRSRGPAFAKGHEPSFRQGCSMSPRRSHASSKSDYPKPVRQSIARLFLSERLSVHCLTVQPWSFDLPPLAPELQLGALFASMAIFFRP